MRIFARRGGFLVVAGSLALAATSSAADDMLLMPYSCTVIRSEPMLMRSGDEAYRVMGPREQQTFTACSPADPSRCRQFTLHRFDVECGGVRVPWVAVAVAAARMRNARAWTANGQFHLQMPPRWGMAADDPCARGPDYGPRGWDYDDRWRFDRFARYCADRRMLAPPAVVDMPAGFAPMFGIGVFVAATEPTAPSPPASAATPPALAAGVPAKAQRTEMARQTPEPPPAKKPPVSKADHAQTVAAAPATGPVVPKSSNRPDAAAPPSAATADAPAAPPTTGSIVPKTIVRADPATSGPAAALPSTTAEAYPAPTTGPVVPKIINRPDPATGGPAATPPSTTAEASPAPITGPIVPKIINRPDPATGGPTAPPPTPTAESSPAPTTGPIVPKIINRPDPATSGPTVPAPTPAHPIAEAPPPAAVAPPAAYLPTASSSPQASPAAGGGRIAVSLIGWAGSSPTTAAVAIGSLIIMLVLATFAFVRQREQARLSVQPRDLASLSLEGGLPAASVRAARPWSGWGDAMPSTRVEALRVLGVTADASETAIKKVVDGLRLSWHPDYAIDADDLEGRELRTKQVNAAWDIIRGKRAAA
jgi:hypothetical protein